MKFVIYSGLLIVVLILIVEISHCDFNSEISWNDENEIWFAQSSPFSGTYSATGKDLQKGILEAFNEINLLGGVLGSKKLKLMSLDDAYDADKTLKNVNYYLSLNQTFFGFIGFFGSRTIQSVYKKLTAFGYPLIGSYTGAQFLRTPFNRNIINVVRPSYYDEVVSLLDYLFYNKDARKISIFYQTDIFGSDAFVGVVESLNYFGVKLCSQSPYNVTTNNLNDIEQSVKNLAQCNPDSIIIVALTNATQTFLNHVFNSNLFRKDINIVATSINSDTLVRVLGYNISSKIIFNQAVPDPTDVSNPLVATFQKARKVFDPNSNDFGSVAELEGYLIGKFTYNLLQRTTGNLTRNNFINELYHSQEILIDRMRIGTFSDCSNSSSCVNACNQGSKTFWRDRVSIDGILKNVNVFTWYSVCTSTPSSIRFPYLIGQVVFKHENYSKINTFLKEGIYNGLSLKNINSNEIHLISLEYETIQDLFSKTIELITSYNVIAIAGITGLENFNEKEKEEFTKIFSQNYTETPIIGLITEDPNLLKPSGHNFLPNFINLKTSVIEQIASLLEYIFGKGFTRISIVYSQNQKDIYDYLYQLLKIVNLQIESQYNCEDNIIFNSTINPHAVIVACNINQGKIIEQIDNFSNFRNDGLFIVLNDIFLANNINNLSIKRNIIFSTPFNTFNSSSIYLSELFSKNTKYTSNEKEYLNSSMAIEGFYIGDFISFMMDSLSDASRSISGKSFIEYLYSIENINLHGQVIGTFSNVKLPFCNLGIRQRYIYQFNEMGIQQVHLSKFSTEQCGLQQIKEGIESLSFSRPFQFIKLVKSDDYFTDSITVEYQDDFTEGVKSYFSSINENSLKYYPFTFQIVTKLYKDNAGVKTIITDLASKQHMFAFINPDISETDTASYLIEQCNKYQIPLISPESSNQIFRQFSRYIFNLFPSIIDQATALVNYFTINYPSKSIILLIENDNYWYDNDWINTLSDILEDGFIIKVKIQPLETYTEVKDDILLLFTKPKNVIQFYNSKIFNLQEKPIIGLISDIYNTLEISEFLYSIGDPSFIYTPVIELLNSSSYVTAKFNQVFQSYNSSLPSATNKALNGFITALFIDEVFESFISLKNKSPTDFMKKVFEIGSFDIGDLKLGSFIDCTLINNSQCTSCNQGIRSMIITKAIRVGDVIQQVESGRYSFESCGVVAAKKDLTSHVLLFVLVILVTLIILMIILLSTLVAYKIVNKGKESQHAPISKGTFAFTDIQNSTFLWQTNEKAMKIALAIHNKIMRRNIKMFKGYEVKTQGDSFFVAFKNPDDAIHWSLKVQSDLMKAKWPSDIMTQYDCRPQFDENTKKMAFSGLRVRIGIHCGQVETVNDKTVKRIDYFGSCINQAARIESIALGGMVLISEDLFNETEHLFKKVILEDRVILDINNTELNNKKKQINPNRSIYIAEDFGYCSLKGIKEYVKVFSISNDETKFRNFVKVGKSVEDLDSLSYLSTSSLPNYQKQTNIADFLKENPTQLDGNSK